MVFRVEAREGGGIFDQFLVQVGSVDPPSIAVLIREDRGEGWVRTTYEYPSGKLLDSRHVASIDRAPAPRFDFDGDATDDSAQWWPGGRVRVVSGANGAVLFEDSDELEYEDPARIFALGDLDRDGFGELALVHPRNDRSDYDFVLWDGLLGVNSWVTVVSGKRALDR
jgi:hypothetical protein